MQVKNPFEIRRKLREYYKNVDLWLPSDSSHRHFRFKTLLPSGKIAWKKIKDRIDTKDKLRAHLLRETPVDCYYTVSRWLNPSQLGKKKRTDVLLGSDFIIDMDTLDTSVVKENYDYLKSRGYDDLLLLFSGGGWHIRILNWFDDIREELPQERVERCFKEMKKFCMEMIDEGLQFDYFLTKKENIISVSYDAYRISKLPQTITKYGNVSQIVHINQIDNFKPKKILDIEFAKPIKLDLRMDKDA